MIFLIIILGFVFRLISLNQSLWLDEATSALVAKNFSFTEIITKFAPGDFHPPFYYLILKLWSTLFGYSEVSLRFPSVIFGIATIYVIYLIGKELFNKELGLVAALLLATSGLHVYYSQEARMYSLATLLVSILILLFMKRKWLFFSITLALLAMLDYVSLLILPALFISGLVTHKSNDWWKKFLLSNLLLVVIFLVWSPIFVRQLQSGLAVSILAPGWWKILGVASVKNIALVPVKFILGRISFDNKFIYGVISGTSIMIFGGLMLIKESLKGRSQKLLWLWFLMPIAELFILSFKIPGLSYFRLLFILPVFYLLVASGVNRLGQRFFKFAIAGVLIVNLLSTFYYLLTPRFYREDWRNLTEKVEGKKTSNSITIFVADSNMEAYRYYAPDAKIAGPEGIRKGYDQIWLMRYVVDVFDPNDKVRSSIESLGYKKQGEFDFNGVVVWEYTK